MTECIEPFPAYFSAPSVPFALQAGDQISRQIKAAQAIVELCQHVATPSGIGERA